MTDIYHDNGRAFGRRTRFFRDAEGGVEWMYGVDYAAGSRRWFFFHPGAGKSIEEMKRSGMFLSRLDNGSMG